MIYLILTIFVSAFIYVIFKAFDKYNVNTFQAIVMNYLVCAVLGFLFSDFSDPAQLIEHVKPALPYAIVLGILFITIFNMIALTAQKFGVGIASISDKLSLVIPVLFAFIFYDDSITVLKVLGIAFSIIAVFLAVSRKGVEITHKPNEIYFPVAVFIGGGLISLLLKEVQLKFPTINYNTFLIFLFGVAFLIGMSILLFQIATKRTTFEPKSILAGLLFGIPNYASIYFLLQTLNTPNWESSIVFPLMNIGIVVFTTLLGILIYKEKLNNKNKLGVGLAILAITLLLIENLNG